jgi:acetylglutamate kinase
MSLNLHQAQQIAQVLTEALPYIQQFAGSTMVIKYGGNAMTNPELKSLFARDVVLLKVLGIHPVIVHGGGPQIGQMLTQMGKPSEFIDGLRVTDAQTMEVVEMVLGGLVNKDIVSLINRQGGRAMGLSGKDGNLIMARKHQHFREASTTQPATWIDLGQVGEVEQINTAILNMITSSDFIPVIAPIGVDAAGNAYNINADTVAAALAAELRCQKLIVLTNTPGILDQQQTTLNSLSAQDIQQLIADGTIAGGMLPKVQAALRALTAGVKSIHIIDGRIPHAVLLEVLTSAGVGTQIQ